jgi:hypothetical protein
MSAKGGLALVGEEGPEVISMPMGAQVDNAMHTRMKLNQADRYNAPQPRSTEVHVHVNQLWSDDNTTIKKIGRAVRNVIISEEQRMALATI